ncbi:hypothetical protein [Geomicrobium sediminis]|uniref:DNA-binding MarR family transcriptional regulator n=1 Tax=Geomicrobium sediminis TaxID=1347788 RepID=A0ABS2PFK9_9BACL|nr:hypothetical protein [Geomicrobium sediminis]MBM7634209.1 DNA-binding MarR family transcriptional regulator [Geomicrobium sediminis]
MQVRELGKIGKGVLRNLYEQAETYVHSSRSINTNVIEFPGASMSNTPRNIDSGSKLRVSEKQLLAEMQRIQQNINHNRSLNYYMAAFSEEDSSEMIQVNYRLPKYAILTYLMYHFLPVHQMGEDGVVEKVNVKEVAAKLKCSIKTVEYSNKRLSDMGLIYVSNCGKGYINVLLPDYQKYHSQGGYFWMPWIGFKELVGLNVNSLRAHIRYYLVTDNAKAKERYNPTQPVEPSRITKNDLKLMLPKYTHFHRKLTEITQVETSAFDTSYIEGHVYVSVNQDFDGQLVKKQREKEFKTGLSLVLDKQMQHYKATEQEINTYVQFCFEYSPYEVSKALNIMDQAIGSGVSIVNPGGYIRTQIRILHTQSLAS